MPEPAEGGPLMAWGKSPADELAADEAARVAQERAAQHARMTPYQQQLLAVLGEVRDELTTIVTLMPYQHPQQRPTQTAESVTPPTDSVTPAGDLDIPATDPGGHPHT